MWDTIEPYFWSFVLRMVQAFIWASPYVLFGAFAAGILRAFVRPAEIRMAFNGRTWPAQMRLWLFTIVLPWSSFGVLSAARQLRKAGVHPSLVLTFLLAAPIVNPLTLAYAFSVMPPSAAFVFVAGAVAVPAAVALLCGWLFSFHTDQTETTIDPPAPAGNRRMLLAFVSAARELTGPLLGDLLIGLSGVGLLAAFVPSDVMELTLAKVGLRAPPLAVLVAVPAYLSPHQGMMVAGIAFSEGNSLGAAFVLLLLGVGINLGWLWWVGSAYGGKRLIALLGILFTLAVLYGYGADAALPHLRTSLDHHHALTDLGQLENFGSGAEAFHNFKTRAHRETRPPEQMALFCLAVLAAAGVVLRLLDRKGTITNWLTAPAENSVDALAPWWNPSLTRRKLIATGIVCCLATIVTSLYVYFPSPDALLVDLQYTATDVYVCGSTGDKLQALERMDKLETLVGKLPASAILRRGILNGECRRDVARLRECTLALRQAVDRGAKEDIKTNGLGFQQILRDFHRAYDPAAVRVSAAG